MAAPLHLLFAAAALMVIVHQVEAQGVIGFELPCGDPNLSCPRLNTSNPVVCYDTPQLCDNINFCGAASDEGNPALVPSLDCDGRISGIPGLNRFVCTSGENILDLNQLCDGQRDCGGGDDEITTLCANKCREPYYGGCPLTRECISGEFDINCGLCRPEFAEDPFFVALNITSAGCLVILTVSFEQVVYVGDEGVTIEICAAVTAPNVLNADVDATFAAISGTLDIDIDAIFSGGAGPMDVVGAIGSYSFTTVLRRDCIFVTIANDNIAEIQESFLLLMSVADPVAVGDLVAFAINPTTVIIPENDGPQFRFTINNYQANEGDGVLQGAIQLDGLSSTLTAPITVFVSTTTFGGGIGDAIDIFGGDFTPLNSFAVPFFAGDSAGTSRTFTVTINDDALVEGFEDFGLTASVQSPGSFVAGGDTATAGIVDNDVAVFAFVNDPYNVNEGVGSFFAQIQLFSGILTFPLPIDVSSGIVGPPDNALPNSDFTPFSDNINVPVSLTPGQSFNVGPIFILSDSFQENTERFVLNADSTSPLVAFQQFGEQADVNIVDNDNPIVGFADPEFTNNESDGDLEACLVLSGASPLTTFTAVVNPIPIAVPNAAIPDVDYTSNSVTVIFTAGTPIGTQVCADIPLDDDNVVEMQETFLLTVSSATASVDPSANSATGFINDNDNVVFAFVGSPFSEDESGPLRVSFIISNNVVLGFPVTVTVTPSATGGTATVNADYSGAALSSVFAAGSTQGSSGFVDVPLVDDILLEGNENFFLTGSASRGTFPGTATGIILDNDAVTFAVINTPYNVNENVGSFFVQVQQQSGGTLTGAVAVTLQSAATIPIDAIAGLDYTTFTQTQTFPANSVSGSILSYGPIFILDDTVAEGIESFRLLGTENGVFTTFTNEGQVNINDLADVPMIGFSVNTFNANEGDQNLLACVTLMVASPATSLTVTVSSLPNTGSAIANVDYDVVSVPVTFVSTDVVGTERCAPIPIDDDIIVEDTESFQVELTTADPSIQLVPGATLATGVIADNDDPVFQFQLIAFSEEENDSPLVATVFLANSGAVTLGITVTVTVTASQATPASALLGADFAGGARTVTFGPGATQGTASFALVDDLLVEGQESFDLTGATNRGSFVGSSVGNIIDNDFAELVFINDPYLVNENVGSFFAQVQLVGGGTTTNAVQFSVNSAQTNPQQAIAGSDYQPFSQTMTLPANSVSGTILSVGPIIILGDTVAEANEDFLLIGGSTSAVVSFNDQAVVTITDDDDAVIGFTLAAYSAEEGNTIMACVTLSGATPANSITAIITPQNTGTAIPNTDYISTPVSVTFFTTDTLPSERCAPIPTNEDIFVEGDENFGLTLSAVGAILAPGASSANAGIIDDDFPRFEFSATQYVESEAGGPFFDVAVVIGNGVILTFPIPVTVQSNGIGSAIPGLDFLISSESQTFPANAGFGTSVSYFTFGILDDFLVEGTENYQLSGSVSAPSTFGAPALAVINDNDVAQADLELDLYPVNENQGSVTVCAVITNNVLLGNNQDVLISTASGQALDGLDFTGINGFITLTFGPSSSRECVTLAIINDALDENTECFTVILSMAIGSSVVVPAGTTSQVCISDEDMLMVGYVSPVFTGTEASGELEACIEILGPAIPQNDVQVLIRSLANSGTASANTDYQASSFSVVFPANSPVGTERCVGIQLFQDGVLEDTETFGLDLQEVPGSTIDIGFPPPTNTATGFITDNSVITVLLIAPPTVPEQSGPARIYVRLGPGIPPVQRPTTLVVYGLLIPLVPTPGVPPATAPQDFIRIHELVTFPVGSMSGDEVCLNITINDDNLCEGNEAFSVVLQSNDTALSLPPAATIIIVDDDVAVVQTDELSYTVTEFVDMQLIVTVQINNGVQKGPGRECQIMLTTLPGSASRVLDYTIVGGINQNLVLDSTTSAVQVVINIVDDDILEDPEDFTISIESASPGCVVNVRTVPVTILDDEDCGRRDNCVPNAECAEIPGPFTFTCPCWPGFIGDGFENGTRCMRTEFGDDPHFSIVMPDGKLLCYTVQGEHSFSFNLISNEHLHMNARFVPDSRREEVTWLGSIGMVVQNSAYMDRSSNKTKLRFEAIENMIYIGDKVALQARNIEKMVFKNGKLVISEAPPVEGFKYPSVFVDLQDVDLSFTIKFMNEHLDLFWHTTGPKSTNSHGLIGQFFRKGIEIDEVRKILVMPGKNPVPIMRKPVWSFMEREQSDDQLCWTAMNPGYQGEGLIDGKYFDYLVDDVLNDSFWYAKSL